jgi:organic radical activating enzyme
MIDAKGSLYPCCRTVAFSETAFGNVASLKNTNKFKNLKNEMILGIKNKACSECHLLEEKKIESPRINAIKKYSQVCQEIVTNPNSQNDRIESLDIRLSNLCNFKCRTCGPEASTAWYDDFHLVDDFKNYLPLAKEIGQINNDHIVDLIKKNIKDLKEIYFAGGEPLLNEKHYEILNILLDAGRTDIIIKYNSNLSIIKYRNKQLTDIWNQFRFIEVQVSIDHTEKSFEYLRQGHFKYHNIVENFKQVAKNSPHINLESCLTISALNIFEISKIIRDLLRDHIITERNKILFNIVYAPTYYSLNVLTLSEKKMIRQDINFLIKELYLNVSSTIFKNLYAQLKMLADTIPEHYDSQLRMQFFKVTSILDKSREQNYQQHLLQNFHETI